MAWGLGHATRIIPIIYELQKSGHCVTLATNEELVHIIRVSIPNVKAIPFYSPKVLLGRGKYHLLPLLRFLLNLPFTIYKEKRELKKLLSESYFNLTISDNRYGFRCKNVKSVIITHQLSVIPPKPFGFTGGLGECLIRYLLSRFNEVWVPDTSEIPSVAGILSESNHLGNVSYIGTLSRFAYVKHKCCSKKWDVVVLISGPEPQRTQFVDQCIKSLSPISYKSIIIEGKPKNSERVIGNVTIAGTLDNESMVSAILQSDLVIARSGYSTIMDLLCIQKSAVLIPTPGQTEQEYLAIRMKQLGWFYTLNQGDVSTERVLEILQMKLPQPSKKFDGKPKIKI